MKLLLAILGLSAVARADNNTNVEILRETNDIFTAKMFQEVAKSNPGKSVIMSAFSILPALGELALASTGDSHKEIMSVLNFSGDDMIKSVFSPFKSIISSPSVTVAYANRVYIREGSHLNEQFALKAKDVFDIDVLNVDFSKSVETSKAINKWVEEQTNNRIKDLVDSNNLNAATSALLVNAIYFKGSWKQKFEKTFTTEQDFYLSKEKTVKLPFMTTTASFRYAESNELNAKLLELPYEGDQASFLVILPNEVDGLAALVEKLKDPSVLKQATDKLNTQQVQVSLPKFKVETTIDLIQMLKEVGITKLFKPTEAHLDNLLKETSDLYISNAQQKAFIEIDEEGSEAAAANVIIMSGSSGRTPLTFLANKPFCFQLSMRNNSLFSGVYAG